MFTPVLSARLSDAVQAVFDIEIDPELRPAVRPEFGDLQSNVALRLAGPLGLPARTVAERLVAALDVGDLCEPPEVAGPGFVNLTLLPEQIVAGANQTAEALPRPLMGKGKRKGDHLPGEGSEGRKGRVVVDYSSPNIARRMQVHHLRSTVIGDALCRVLSYVGYEVVRQNHLGDWGTQFGMLIQHLIESQVEPMDLPGLEVLYKESQRRFDQEDGFADRARKRVVALQSGDPATLDLWRRIVDISVTDFEAIYDRLGIDLQRSDIAGESSYNDALPGVVRDLDEAGLLTESEGALCVFPETDGSAPMIVRKSDGGFGYSATDLAAVRHRVDVLEADWIVILTDARQDFHFEQVFAVARQAGWLPETVRADHVSFGSILGPGGKPFRTREGGTMTLTSLLDEAEARITREVAVGAIKYADLVNDRSRDYVYSLDRMIASDGNTGPYLQYAHARLAKIVRKSGGVPGLVGVLDHPAERRLAFLLTGFGEAVEQVAETLQPHRLCGYLYDVATAASVFYESCPVLRSEGATRVSRIALSDKTRLVLAQGLDLLGIPAPDEM